MIILISRILKAIIILVPTLIRVAYLTLLERKVLASMQRRIGPNVVGVFGLLQPFADGLKLVLKEFLNPLAVSRQFFSIAPLVMLNLALVTWRVIPFAFSSVLIDFDLSILYILTVSSFSVYSVLFAGWGANSVYAFSGALRSAAQIISYEISIGLILLNVLIIVGSFNLSYIVLVQYFGCWFIIPFFPLFILFFISVLAETRRAPFDLPEAEGELVAGYNTEYSAGGFALFFIREYVNYISMSVLISILFFGGWLPAIVNKVFMVVVLRIKSLIILFSFIWIRAALPRYRYDQLMRLGWKVFLPFVIGSFLLTFVRIWI